eukprot:COSAG01_NODE_3100_length_6587_cov_11.955302_7_plen_93_part_00
MPRRAADGQQRPRVWSRYQEEQQPRGRGRRPVVLRAAARLLAGLLADSMVYGVRLESFDGFIQDADAAASRSAASSLIIAAMPSSIVSIGTQ